MENQRLIRNVSFISGEKGNDLPQQVDLRLSDHSLMEIGRGLQVQNNEVQETGSTWYLSPAWMDLFSVVTDPGFEWKESREEWARQAARGGFGSCLIIPETTPAADRGEMVRSLLQYPNLYGVETQVAAAVTSGKSGKQLAELRDAWSAGACIFSEGLKPSLSAARMRIALEYLKSFDGSVMVFPLDGGMAENGQIHEGKSALATGLTGIPSLAESLLVYRDSELARITGTPVHFCGISCADSVEIIRKAKATGAPVTASVFATHLVYTETETETFDSSWKIMPPLRSAHDREVLRQAVVEGTLDGIASGHVPCAPEEKNLEFPYAAFGRRGLETCFDLAWESLVTTGLMQPAALVSRFVTFPRQLTRTSIPRNAYTLWRTDAQNRVVEKQLLFTPVAP